MKVQEVITRAASGQLTWWQAAEILGVTDRHLRRLREKWAAEGYDGLFDRRRQQPSPKRVPLGTLEEVLRLYRTQYANFNVHVHCEVLFEPNASCNVQLGRRTVLRAHEWPCVFAAHHRYAGAGPTNREDTNTRDWR
jgi:hypothetical protein